jgi:hypothetical protein
MTIKQQQQQQQQLTIPDAKEVLTWAWKGTVSGALYGAWMASRHGLIGTRTSRTMVTKSAIIVGTASTMFPIARLAYRHALRIDPITTPTVQVREGAVAGAVSGVTVGALMGRAGMALGWGVAVGVTGAIGAMLQRQLKEGRMLKTVNEEDLVIREDGSSGPIR